MPHPRVTINESLLEVTEEGQGSRLVPRQGREQGVRSGNFGVRKAFRRRTTGVKEDY